MNTSFPDCFVSRRVENRGLSSSVGIYIAKIGECTVAGVLVSRKVEHLCASHLSYNLCYVK